MDLLKLLNVCVQIALQCGSSDSLLGVKSSGDPPKLHCPLLHCPALYLYLSELSNVFAQFVKCICPNCTAMWVKSVLSLG